MKILIQLFFVMEVVFLLTGCRSSVGISQLPKQSPKPPEVISFKQDSIDNDLRNPHLVYHFYYLRKFTPAWCDSANLLLKDSIFRLLQSAPWYGLHSSDYHTKEIQWLINNSRGLSRQEVLLTDGLLTLMHDVKYGTKDSTHVLTDTTSIDFLNRIIETKAPTRCLVSLEPKYKEYHLLKKALSELLQTTDSLNNTNRINNTRQHSTQIAQIEINLERWRQETADLGSRYLWINIPAFQLQFIENDEVTLRSKVIVGKPATPTPSLTSTINCFTLFPFWIVPRKIAVGEYLPQIQKDTSFLTRSNFIVLDKRGKPVNDSTIEWIKYGKNYFPFTLKQLEGRKNSLGLVKFIFENPYAVYLHDTNSKKLFNSDVRAFSHGCIRMEKALEFAELISPNKKKYQEALKSEKRSTFFVPSFPIYIRYYTCEFTDGKIKFLPDIYLLDKWEESFY